MKMTIAPQLTAARERAAGCCAVVLAVGLIASVPPSEPDRFDYVIVGAGAAGSVLASRLTEHPGVSVLVLEAGGPDDDPRIHQPSSFRELPGSDLDWRLSTEPEARLADRRIPWPRGKVWGGSGSLSAMVYVRGHPSDFERWREMGNEGWAYEDVLPYFRKAENQERGPSRHHGTGGPHNVADPRYVPSIALAFVASATELGFARTEDFNGESSQGVGLFQLNQKNGERHSTSAAYLRPALNRSNLRLESHARAVRVLFEGTRARGVRYLRDGRVHESLATREVVLAAGAVGSPHLLLLSGVGPREHLRELGIELVRDLPGVGGNLQDHPRVAITYRSRLPLGPTSAAEQERVLLDYHVKREGPLSSNGVGAGLFVAFGEGEAPDCEVILSTSPQQGTFSLHAVLLHPQSRGTIRLAASDATRPPLIRANYLADERDEAGLARGLALARRLAASSALAAYRGEGVGLPGAGTEAVARYIRENATTFYHPVGTCRMGVDVLAVVDPELRVRGLAGLRVIDASVIPTIVSGATHAATVMIAEKGADLLKRSWTAAPSPR